MSRNMARVMSVCGSVILLASASASASPFYGGGTGGVDPSCVCAQPVVQTCYQTVPVTEYRQVRQTVQRPVYETKYVDQEVVAYRPVVETRTVDVPTVTYQDVVEYQPVVRDMGGWQTEYQVRHLPSPCEYDPRPGLVGWLNRTGYQVRAAFTPRVVAHRQYVPNVVATSVPVTRRVAQHGTRQVSYNVTRMVAYTTNQKVAVNTVRYVAEEVTRVQPVTVMRTVPTGTSLAYAYTPFGASSTATALAPTPDPVGTAAQPSTKRTANAADGKNEGGEQPIRGRETEGGAAFDSGTREEIEVRRLSHPVPSRKQTAGRAAQPQAASGGSVPSIVQASRWMARRRLSEANSEGPSLVGPSISVADSNR